MLDKLLNWASDLMSSQEDEQQQWMCGMNFSYLLVIYILEYFFFFLSIWNVSVFLSVFFFVLFLERCFVSVHRADTVLRCTATLSSVSGLITFISQSLSKCWNRLQDRDVGNDPSYILHTSLQKKKNKAKGFVLLSSKPFPECCGAFLWKCLLCFTWDETNFPRQSHYAVLSSMHRPDHMIPCCVLNFWSTVKWVPVN